MNDSDWIPWIVCALVGCFFCYWSVGSNLLAKTYKYCFAAFLRQFETLYNSYLGGHKDILFAGLHKLSEEVRPGQIDILEVGAGTGTNFKFFPKGSNVICVDPNPYFESYLQSKRELFADVNITEFVVGYGEDLSAFLDNSLDAVVCTLVLCSVDDPDQCLREFKRVLKPGGKLFFMEHVCADQKSWLQPVQKLIRPLWRYVFDNCNPTRESWKTLEAAEFSSVSQERFMAPWWFLIITPHLMGVATK